MAIAVVSSTTAISTSTQVTSLAINVPASTVNGDVLCTAVTFIQGVTVTAPSGWTVIATASGSSGVSIRTYYRVASSEPASYTWLFGTASTVAMSMTRMTGVDNTSPLRTSGTASAGSATTVTPATLTGVQATDMVLIQAGCRPDLSGAPTLTMPSTSGWATTGAATATDTTFPSVCGTSYKINGTDTPAVTTSAACEIGVASAAFAAAAGTTYNQAFTDTTGLVDTVVTAQNYNKAISDAAGITDSEFETDTVVLPVDTAGLIDTVAVNQTGGNTVITFTDTTGSTDTTAQGYTTVLSDASSLTDPAVTYSGSLASILVDGSGLTDSIEISQHVVGGGTAGGVAIGQQISSYMNSGLLSRQFYTAVRESHRVTAKADVWFGGSYVTSVPIVSGNITVDRTSQNCRSGSCTIGDPAFFPSFVTSPLAPFGVELRIFYGITYGSLSTEWIPVGVFTIEDVYAEDSTGGLPVVDFFDRSKVIQRANFFYPRDRSGWDARSLIYHLVQDVCGVNTKVFIDPALTYTKILPGGTVFSEDRWSALQTCCGLLGGEGRFGWDGNFYVVPIPNLLGVAKPPSVWEFNAGAGGVLVSAKRGVSRTGVANFVAVTGKSNGANQTPVGYAWDSDSRSPTYWGPTQNSGELSPTPFGPNVVNLSNDLLTTDEECQAYAVAQLGHYLGLARTLDFSAIPNPALDAGDIVRVTYKNGDTEYHVLDAFQLPLGVGLMGSGTGRNLNAGRRVYASTKAGYQAENDSGGGRTGVFIGRTRTLTYQTTAGT